jgi:proteasome accessory factor B
MAYEVNTRTIQRDIEFLRDRLGVPIAFDRKENRYAIEDDFAHIPPLELKETDFLLLSFLQQCLAPYAATEIGGEMNKSFERLFGLLTGTRKWKEWAEPILWRSENVPRGNPKELKIFHLLQRAITRRKEVTFHYKPLRKPAARRTIQPLLQMMHKGRWYLYGAITGKKEITPFSFDRISEVEITATGFDPADYPDPRALLRHSFGVAISSDPPFDVVLEFESRVAERVRESHWHPDQKLEELPEGRVRLTLLLNTTMELESWIRGWGPYVRVIEPKDLTNSLVG